jgi:dihydroorotate dehydrogenase (NAD+) catalytic subunit
MANLKVNIAGVEFKNPVITASGTYGFGREYNEFFSVEKLGGISCKGTTVEEAGESSTENC